VAPDPSPGAVFGFPPGGGGGYMSAMICLQASLRLTPIMKLRLLLALSLVITSTTFAADLPDGFWITTIYTDKAEAIYSVNNRQSGANSFTVSLSRAPGIIEQIIKATEKEAIADIDSGWTVTSPEPRGLAVVWYPTPEIGLRSIAAEQVARSRCTAAPAPQS